MEEGLEQGLQPLAAGGLLGLHGADFGHAGGELLCGIGGRGTSNDMTFGLEMFFIDPPSGR